ncbi:MAG TPA: alpha/beta hydrolase [Chloroflexia bacterium]|nr:alpha/beta hydrolase [Chloroflexia bacterium]
MTVNYNSDGTRMPDSFFKPEPVVISGGFMSSPGDYLSWQKLLASRSIRRRSVVTKIGRSDWYMTRNSDFSRQLAALDSAVKKARQISGSEKVWLVCHSAGGTVARLWMGDTPYNGQCYEGYSFVKGIIFLGSPYISAEPNALKAVEFLNERNPGAYFPEIKYVSVAGKSIFGKANGSFLQRMAFKSYSKVTPAHPQQWGDGVITLEAAYMPGATNITLTGINHISLLGQPGYSASQAMEIWGRYFNEVEGDSGNHRTAVA